MRRQQLGRENKSDPTMTTADWMARERVAFHSVKAMKCKMQREGRVKR